MDENYVLELDSEAAGVMSQTCKIENNRFG